MKSVSGREFARTIERRGWTLLRINGSHHIYGKSGSIVRLSVPIHGNKPLKTGLHISRSLRTFPTVILSKLVAP
jgi:predicted RNA binding protein YcfA (HicA-like mRNA interferase family)